MLEQNLPNRPADLLDKPAFLFTLGALQRPLPIYFHKIIILHITQILEIFFLNNLIP